MFVPPYSSCNSFLLCFYYLNQVVLTFYGKDVQIHLNRKALGSQDDRSNDRCHLQYLLCSTVISAI